MVTARGPGETAVFYPERMPLVQVLALYDQDYVVLEGQNEFFGPGILSAKNTEEIDAKMRDTVFAITGRISAEISEYKNLPVINALTDVKKLVDLIEVSVPDWLGQKGWT